MKPLLLRKPRSLYLLITMNGGHWSDVCNPAMEWNRQRPIVH